MPTYQGGLTLQLFDRAGSPYVQRPVSVYAQDTTDLATLYTSRTGTVRASNPAWTDAYGRLSVYTTPGFYDLSYDNGLAVVEDVVVVPDSDEVADYLDNQQTVVSVIATADGLTTGLVPSTATIVSATNATDANDIITLPTPSAGKKILVLATEACEVRTAATSGITINGVDSDGTNEAALAVGSHAVFVGLSATAWLAEYWIANGTPTVLTPDTA